MDTQPRWKQVKCNQPAQVMPVALLHRREMLLSTKPGSSRPAELGLLNSNGGRKGKKGEKTLPSLSARHRANNRRDSDSAGTEPKAFTGLTPATRSRLKFLALPSVPAVPLKVSRAAGAQPEPSQSNPTLGSGAQGGHGAPGHPHPASLRAHVPFQPG